MPSECRREVATFDTQGNDFQHYSHRNNRMIIGVPKKDNDIFQVVASVRGTCD